jgi:hypothetical protein
MLPPQLLVSPHQALGVGGREQLHDVRIATAAAGLRAAAAALLLLLLLLLLLHACWWGGRPCVACRPVFAAVTNQGVVVAAATGAVYMGVVPTPCIQYNTTTCNTQERAQPVSVTRMGFHYYTYERRSTTPLLTSRELLRWRRATLRRPARSAAASRC